MAHPKALIFDVFGTCVDWRQGVANEAASWFAELNIDADPVAFAAAWRGEYQPAMERIRSGSRGYSDLDDLHLENLDIVLDRFRIANRFDEAARKAFNRAWEKLPPWPDTVPGLAAIRQQAIIAPCSNGSIALMTHLARYAKLPWDCIVGAGVARDYKPKPVVYLASCRALRLEPEEVMMVAAHNDDLAAAEACGLMTAFVARPTEHGTGQTSDLAPSKKWTVSSNDFLELSGQLAHI
ncbi:MAG: haloacid dehalogenase type II [Rhizobiaceae bacterium]